MTALRLEGLTHVFKGATRPILSQLNLAVSEGERISIVGPSGAGKTTLLRLIAGFEHPQAGKVFLGERDVTGLPPEQRDIAFVFQNHSLYPQLTIGENLAFPLRLRGVSKSEIQARVRETAQLLRLELPMDARPAQLSGGESQLVALARGLIRKPAAILMDEPLSDVPPDLRHFLRQQVIRMHEAARRPLLYVTHDHEEAMVFGERVAVLAQGRIEQIGTPREIYETPATVFVATFVSGSNTQNFIRGECVQNEGFPQFKFPGFKAMRVSSAASSPAIFIRPEHIELCAPESAWARGQIREVQYSGAFSTLVVEIESGKELLARVFGPRRFAPGEVVSLRAAPENVHLFGAVDRLNIQVLEV